jgi:pimeloyl-ACP methyl ester carboxylesterase
LAEHTPVWPAEPAFTGRQGKVDVGGARLHYWDNRVDGPVVLLLHPHTGGGEIWGHQHAAFARAGLRTVSYSRRGYHHSDRGPAGPPVSAAEDLRALIDALGIKRCHLLGTGSGGGYALGCALALAGRVRTLTLANSLLGLTEPDFAAETATLLGASWRDLPEEVRELGPAYRAGNPLGLARWRRFLARSAGAVPQAMPGVGGYAAIASISAPTLLLGGDADRYLPPARLRRLAARFADHEVVILPGVGHAAFWEQPAAFNAAVLDFIARRDR